MHAHISACCVTSRFCALCNLAMQIRCRAQEINRSTTQYTLSVLVLMRKSLKQYTLRLQVVIESDASVDETISRTQSPSLIIAAVSQGVSARASLNSLNHNEPNPNKTNRLTLDSGVTKPSSLSFFFYSSSSSLP